jgi:hypothetical protein
MHVWLVQSTRVPQVPDIEQVWTPLPVHWLEPGVQATQVLFRHAAVAPAQVADGCQLPIGSHARITEPRHCVWFGAQPPMHVPVASTHVWLVQGGPSTQEPVIGSHVCGVLPLHRVCPGAHEPVQTPLMHVWFMHGTGVPHPPMASQVETPFPEHCVSFITHTPLQTPL